MLTLRAEEEIDKEMSSENPLSLFRTESEKYVRKLATHLDLKTVVLDDWAGIRLIYETSDVRVCTGRCAECNTFLVLGEDDDESENTLNKRLIKTTNAHTDITKYPMLNCKTFEDYMNSFLEWIVNRCISRAEFVEELTLIKNFQIIYSAKCITSNELKTMKQQAIDSVLEKAKEKIVTERRYILEKAIEEVFGET